MTSKIDKPTLDAKGFDEKISKKLAQIEKLKKEIELIKGRKLTIGKEIEDAKIKITQTRDQFSEVYEYFAKQLDNDKVLYEQLIN
jgi:peptidoglycan hydrolase CwlO-like protein